MPHPPKLPLHFFRWFCHRDLRDSIEGDLIELYGERVKEIGKRKADWKFAIDVLLLFRPGIVRKMEGYQPVNNYDMYKSYFKIAWRNIIHQKAYSTLNIVGLSIGMACSILIFLWVWNELNYDRFHANANQIYRITASAGDFKAAVSPAGMAGGLQAEMPEIENSVRLSKLSTALFEAGEHKFEEKGLFFADSNFLEFFSYSLLQGNSNTAMNDPNGILITENMARKYFGKEEALGQYIRINNNENFTVTGILANGPSNSHLQFDFIIPMSALAKSNYDLQNNVWNTFNFYTYLQFYKNIGSSPSDIQQLIERIDKIYKAHEQHAKIDFQLQPLTDIHLRSNFQIDLPGHGNIQYVNIFFVVAVFILLVACINFMNLATARSARRAKEVGLRKVVGAGRYQIILQFLGESLIISFLSLFVAISIVFLFLPVFNVLTEKELTFHLLDWKLWVSLIAIAVLTGMVSGSYPALFLSGFKPINVLKGKLKSVGGNLLFRNGLVVGQFVIAIVLLVGTAVVYRQLDFIKNRNLGFDKSNLIYMPMTGDIWGKQQALKATLSQNPLTADFSVISDLPTTLISGTLDVVWEGKAPDSQIVIPSMDVDEHFVDVFKMQMLTGRSFSEAFKGDSSNYVINEKAMQVMEMDISNAVGQNLTFGGDRGTIIGVVKDFNFKSLQYEMEPLVLRLNKWGGLVVVRTQPGNTEATIKALEQVSHELNPSYPFTYSFLDQDLNNLYRSEQQMGNIFNVFATLAIFIACLGLYGLAAYMAEQRTKEIGIRKVLGASVSGIAGLLSKDFLGLVVIAFLIASPVAWYLMDKWLRDFAYRIEIAWWMFAVAGLGALVIAVLTVSSQAIKAAIANPVRSLRSE
ncbi:ABC transporter permease [Algoriphagus sp. D3-2-R+10]|uniref:ABC transporter permease n=1 Tax=Algoriphagus aurantiacus TaxID=3103948 RepID=UPI002B389600|nr:ABC transporter permease [Algoriphagus sp. D3-2-R+10]MEB2778182.1 ABC transporter permease [Algoriphagus sp. D3-2-R+10]